jgi:hypothetical protein
MCGVRARCGQKDAYMDNNHVAAYLSDHLTGSVKNGVCAELRTDIEADREEGVCSKIRLYYTFLLTGCSRLV